MIIKVWKIILRGVQELSKTQWVLLFKSEIAKFLVCTRVIYRSRKHLLQYNRKKLLKRSILSCSSRERKCRRVLRINHMQKKWNRYLSCRVYQLPLFRRPFSSWGTLPGPRWSCPLRGSTGDSMCLLGHWLFDGPWSKGRSLGREKFSTHWKQRTYWTVWNF